MLKFSVIGGTMVASFRESGKPFFHMEIDNDATVTVETPTYDEMVEMFQTKYQTAYDTFEDFKKNHNFDTPQRDNQDSGNRMQIDRDANVAAIPGDGDNSNSLQDILMEHFDKIYQMVVNFFDDDSYESEVEKMFNKYLETYPHYKENLTQAWGEYDKVIKQAEYKVTEEFENIKEEAEAAKAADQNAPTTVFASSTPSFNVSAAGKNGLQQLEHEVLHAPGITSYQTTLVSIEAKPPTQWKSTVINGYVIEWESEYTSSITDLFAQEFLASIMNMAGKMHVDTGNYIQIFFKDGEGHSQLDVTVHCSQEFVDKCVSGNVILEQSTEVNGVTSSINQDGTEVTPVDQLATQFRSLVCPAEKSACSTTWPFHWVCTKVHQCEAGFELSGDCTQCIPQLD